MTRSGIPLREYLLPKQINIDISTPSLFGLIGELEEREAAIYSLYNWTKWQQLSYDERVAAISHYRLHLLIDSHIQDAIDKHAAKARRRVKGAK